MNNSLNIDLSESFQEETNTDERLREREAKLVRMLEALIAIRESNEWSSLKDELFDGMLETIEGKLRSEMLKAELNNPEIYRLQGERKWARNFADFSSLIGKYRAELAHIRNVLTPGGGAP